MNEERASRYHRLKRRAGLAVIAWQAALPVILLATGATLAIRDLAAGMARALGPWPALTVPAYVVVVVALLEAGSFPAAFYSGYVLEKRYGLSVETRGQWLRQHLKATGLATAISIAAAVFVLETLRRWPDWWWLVSAAAYSLVVVLLTAVVPFALLPLFYRVTPLAPGGLERRLTELVDRAGVPRPRFFRLGLSARTRKVNAAFAGIGGTRSVLLSDRLIDEYSEEEVAAVVAHEIGHQVTGDVWRAVALEVATGLMAALAAHGALLSFSAAAGLTHPADVAGLPLLALGAGAVSMAASPLACALSRSAERRADRFALSLSCNPRAYASAIRRLAGHNLSELRPSRIVQILYHTHPPVEERIAAAERAAREAETTNSGLAFQGCGRRS
ncbi:MAG: M48 family metalloprotease [Vicinamibacterales bacterium]